VSKLALPARRLLPALVARLSWLPRRAIAVPAAAWELPPTLDDILTEPPPRHLRSTHYLLAVLLLSLLIAASLLKIDIIVPASGRLTTDAPLIAVQPLELSIIREIRIKIGDVVHKGEVLATLDPTFTQADKVSLTKQEAGLRARLRRLEAELDGVPYSGDAKQPDERLQLDLYRQRQAQYAARLREFAEDLQRYREAIRTTTQNLQSAVQQLAVAKQIEAMRAELWQQRVGSRLTLLDAEAARLGAQRDYQDTSDHLTELQHKLKSTAAARQVFVDDWRRQLLDELAAARADAAKLSDSLTKARRINDLVVLTAPEDAVVLDIAKRSVGSVLHPAEPLVTLVPTAAPLIAEVMIRSADVGYVAVGDSVAIKVDAFPYQRHGLLHGRLRSIGEDSVSPGGAEGEIPVAASGAAGVFHRCEVTLTSTRLQRLPAGARLIPGMTLTAEVKVGARSVISFFLYPLERGFDGSMREP
jgi:membrane fusion protein, hemolysin D